MITHEKLKEMLTYNPDTGEFIRQSGKVAGSTHIEGYHNIMIEGKKYLSHRLAWFYMTGTWPVSCIDHVNRVRNDNRWVNLREASRSQNQMNAKVRADNKLGVKNIHKAKVGGKDWYQVTVSNEWTRETKTFAYTTEGLESAISWRDAKLKELHKEFAAR